MYLKSLLFVLGKSIVFTTCFFTLGARLECELHAQTR